MHYGNHQRNQFITTCLFIGLVVCFTSCSPYNRLQRLLKNHPYLVENKIRDSVVIREGKVVDTTLFITATHDTIQLHSGTTIIRSSDTFRFITRIEPCTTFITKRETIFPKTQPKEPTSKVSKWQVYEKIGLIALLILFALQALFRRRQ